MAKRQIKNKNQTCVKQESDLVYLKSSIFVHNLFEIKFGLTSSTKDGPTSAFSDDNDINLDRRT